MKALVTGASGFIGSSLIEELGNLGIEVHALMRKSSSDAKLKGLKYQRVEGDLSDYESLKKAVVDVDYVFHLAGVLFSSKRDHFFDHNVGGTQRLAQAVVESGAQIKRFVFVSSLAAGGPCDGLDSRTELQKDHPVSAYGESKLEAEKELLKFKEKFAISIVRPPIVYGPKDQAILPIVQTVAKNLMLIPRGLTPTGQKYYSAIYVKDLIQGIIQSAQATQDQVSSGEVFYLASDETFTYEDILRSIATPLGKKPLKVKVPRILLKVAAKSLTVLGKITHKTFSLNEDKLNEILPDYWLCSNQKAKQILGFTPKYTLSKGMEETVKWYQQQGWV